MSVVVLKKDINKVFLEIKKNTPIIIFKNFLNKGICRKINSTCHENYSFRYNRKKPKNKFLNFSSIDVLPSLVKTDRIFRTFELSDYFVSRYSEIKDLLKFQKKIFKPISKKKIYRKVQVIHYPKGGGFFDRHHHPRYPTNYGIIITLTEKFKDFNEGVTNFIINEKDISLEKFNLTTGDLILFKYDISHYISPVDPGENLTFDKKGRWTLILPIYHEKF